MIGIEVMRCKDSRFIEQNHRRLMMIAALMVIFTTNDACCFRKCCGATTHCRPGKTIAHCAASFLHTITQFQRWSLVDGQTQNNMPTSQPKQKWEDAVSRVPSKEGHFFF